MPNNFGTMFESEMHQKMQGTHVQIELEEKKRIVEAGLLIDH